MSKVINLGNIPYELTDEALKNIAALNEMPIPEVVKKCADVRELVNLAAEDVPKILPDFVRNDYALANEVCKVGRGLCETAQAVSEVSANVAKVNFKAGIALGLGALALGGVYYLYKKYNMQQEQIKMLAKAVEGQNEVIQMMANDYKSMIDSYKSKNQ